MAFRILIYVLLLAGWHEVASRCLPNLLSMPVEFASYGLGVTLIATLVLLLLVGGIGYDLRRCQPWSPPPPGLTLVTFWLVFFLVGEYSGRPGQWMARHLRTWFRGALTSRLRTPEEPGLLASLLRPLGSVWDSVSKGFDSLQSGMADGGSFAAGALLLVLVLGTVALLFLELRRHEARTWIPVALLAGFAAIEVVSFAGSVLFRWALP